MSRIPRKEKKHYKKMGLIGVQIIINKLGKNRSIFDFQDRRQLLNFLR